MFSRRRTQLGNCCSRPSPRLSATAQQALETRPLPCSLCHKNPAGLLCGSRGLTYQGWA